MSLIALAEAVDRLVESGHAYVNESETTANVSGLSADHTAQLISLCKQLQWHADLFDSAGEAWNSSEFPDPGFAPFRLTIWKPAVEVDSLYLLSNRAFAQWLDSGHAASRWRIARFSGSLHVGGRVLQSWDGSETPTTVGLTKSPRALVKEFGDVRRVPDDVRPWLASDLSEECFSESATQVWVRAASTALISCLPDEIDAITGDLKFRGPPRLSLPASVPCDRLDFTTFRALLDASMWVFENERESEIRHVLLASELARSGVPTGSTAEFLRQHLAHAHESAQLAYQMVLADTGRDTLKALVDLRRAITDETAKLSDMSRQLAGSVAAALATGIALIAARTIAAAPAILVASVMLVVAIYVAVVIASGVHFMHLQRQLRADWQHRLYRFLPPEEYERMVRTPTARAESSFVWTARLGGAAILVLTVACGWAVLTPSPTGLGKSSPVEDGTPIVAPTQPDPQSKRSASAASSSSPEAQTRISENAPDQGEPDGD